MFPTIPPPPQRLLVFASLDAQRPMPILQESFEGTEVEVLWEPTPHANGTSLRAAFGESAMAMQTGESPGDRLSMAFSERMFFHRTEKIVGTDDGGIPRGIVDCAFHLLDSVEYVVGPATGGATYLVGCRALSFEPAVFREVPWGTPDVLSTMLQRIAATGRTMALLPERAVPSKLRSR